MVNPSSALPNSGTATASGLTCSSSIELLVQGSTADCANALAYIDNVIVTANCSSFYSGIYEIGAGGQWETLTEALQDIKGCIAAPVVLELNEYYKAQNEASEIYPLLFSNLSTTSVNTLTIRPKASVASAITMDGNVATTLFDFNGSDYVIIDGRPGGSGTTSMLSMVNTNTAGNVIKLTNSATYNTIKFCTIQGSSAAGSSILFGTSSIGGNSYNTIDNCTVGRYNTNTIFYAIESNGSASNINTNNTISNSNITDFTERGINLSANSSQWIISKNNIYRVSGITTGTAVSLIYINSGDGYTISGNYIGGNAPYCGGTSGSYFTQASGASTYGIYFVGSGTTISQINGNFIKYIANNNSTTSTIYGFYSNHTNGGTINFYDNEISNINHSNTSTSSVHTVYGCNFNGISLALNFYRNKIHTLINAASGSNTYYYGCNFAQTTSSTLNCYNNFISAGKSGISSRTYTVSSSSSSAYFLNNTLEMLTNTVNAYDMHCLRIITTGSTNYLYNNIFKSSALSSTDYYNACIYYLSNVTVNHSHNYYQNNNLTTACVRTGSSTKASFATWEGSANGMSNTTLTLFSNGVVNANTLDVNGTGTNLYNANTFGSSPAITSDIIGRSRPNGAMWMGCYEGVGNIYYSTSSSADASTFTNWKTNRDNTGSSPTNFTASGDIFVVQSGHQYQVTNTNAFTGTSAGYVQIEDGGALDSNAQSMNGWGSLKVSGKGVASSGVFYNSSASESTLSVPIFLNSPSTIKSSGPGGLNLTGNINNNGFALTIVGYNATKISGALTGEGNFVKSGSGILTFSGVANLTFTNLTISGGKVVAEKDITVNGILNLNAVNPNETDGLLDMVINYGDYATGAYTTNSSYNPNDPLALTTTNPDLKNSTSTFNNLNSYVLTLGANATLVGSGDVTGKIRRTNLANGVTYTFGNANTQLTFDSVNGSSLPTQITVVATRGNQGHHSDKENAVKRMFQILRTGGTSETRFTLRLPYEEVNLNANNEESLVLWDHHIPYNGVTPHEHGKTSNSVSNNYIELANHGLFYLATEGDVNFTKYWMISDQVSEVPTWVGAVPGGSWEVPSNWTSGVVPTNLSSIIIPTSNKTPYDPVLLQNIAIGTVEIQADGIFSGGDKTITINGGPANNGGRGSWNNNGTFDAGTGTVVFNYTDATLAGSTIFNNFIVNSGKKVTLQGNTIATVNGTITNSSSSAIETLDTSTLKVTNFSLNDTFTFANYGTLEILGTLTDNRAIKNYGGLVRYAATTGSQTVIGAAYNHLDLTAASTKLFSSDPTVAGNFTISEGSVTPPSLFVFNGNTTQNIVGLPYNNITFSGTGDKIFTSNGSISSSSAIAFDSGAATIDFDGDGTQHFVLKSDSIGTARIGNVGNFNLTGKVSVERFLLNNANSRLWRLLTAPVVSGSNTTIFENWQNNGLINGVTGTDVWGPGSGYSIQNNGMYYLPISTHNFRKYINGAWTSVTNTKTEPLFTADKNNAFLTFIIYPAGSGIAPNGTGAFQGVPGAASTTLVAKGNLLSGTQNYTLNNTNYHLIGNPYASPIDFENLIASNGVNGNTITEKIWLLDPELGDFGNYVTWDPQAGYSNVNSANHIAGAKIIHSGQGFFVKGKSGATSSNFEIKESDKIASNSYIFGRTTTNNYERIRVNLDKISNGVTNHKDACVAVFYNEASNAVTEKDVQKFTNPAETLSFYNGATSLSSEHRAPIVDNDILFIRLTQATANSSYKLKINTENFTFAGSATFHDLKLGVVTLLPLDGSVFEYPFEVTSDPSTQGVRFKIVFTTTLSLEDNPNTDTITIYPNPTSKSEGITINLGTIDFGTYSYRIINPLGQEIQKGDLTNYEFNQEFKINFNTALNSGVYIFEVIENNKNLKTMKLLIE